MLYSIYYQMTYKTDIGVQLCVDNVLLGEHNGSAAIPVTSLRSGHIVLGRFYANTDRFAPKKRRLTVDHLTIWDRPLTDEERNAVHQC